MGTMDISICHIIGVLMVVLRHLHLVGDELEEYEVDSSEYRFGAMYIDHQLNQVYDEMK